MQSGAFAAELEKSAAEARVRSIKVVVWDLDQTVWDGVLLEGDPVALRPGVLQAIQELDRRGILQSICSKNDPASALQKLQALGIAEYFLYPQIGWNAKSAAVRIIAERINVGMDTLAFIDDQPFERAEVAFSHPQILCLDACEVPVLLARPEFNPRFITEDSSRRRLMYMSDAERNAIEAQFEGTKEEFLATLSLRMTISHATENDLQRAEELTRRTHQLNTTGYTYSYDELKAFMSSPDHALLIASLDDRFGAYGKIGLCLIERSRDYWTLKLLLMSCRVMSRGVGTILMNHVMALARQAGLPLRAEFVRTDRNRVMYVTYRLANFQVISESGDLLVFENDCRNLAAFPAHVNVQIVGEPDRRGERAHSTPAAQSPTHRNVVDAILAAGHADLRSRFRAVAQAMPDKLGAVSLDRGEEAGASLTFAGLDRHARSLAGLFQLRQGQGERAIMLLENGVETVYAFLGCVYGRVIAVPMPAPVSGNTARITRYLGRVRHVILDGGIRFVLTTAAIARKLRDIANQMEGLERLEWVIVDELEDRSERWREEPIEPSDLVYMQYTSGSTSTAKGVMITHRNLTTLIDYNGAVLEHHTAGTQAVCWMPYFHDFGLIEGLLVPLCHGMPVYIMTPLDFVQDPMRWMRAVDRYRASHSSGPSFAFDLCARKSTPEQRSRLDLSCWHRASCAAEPIRSSSMRSFIEAYEPHGFSPTAMAPSFGLAEATLLVTLEKNGVRYYDLDAAELENNRVRSCDVEGQRRTMVGCGEVWPGPWEIEVRIVNPETLEATPPGEIGEIWVSGDLVAKGYWNRPEETQALFQAQIKDSPGKRYLRTGDLGFMDGRELVFTGRRKDLIIVEGRNHYPQEIEKTAEKSHPALRPGCSIAFSIDSEGPVQVVYICELTKGYRLAESHSDQHQDGIAVSRAEVEAAIRREVAEDHQLRLHDIVIVPPGTVPKTTSGKLQRSGGKAKYLSGAFRGELPELAAGSGLSWTQVA